jgi:hypothetical protein
MPSYPVRPKNLKKAGLNEDNVAALRNLTKRVDFLYEGTINNGAGSITWNPTTGTYQVTRSDGTVYNLIMEEVNDPLDSSGNPNDYNYFPRADSGAVLKNSVLQEKENSLAMNMTPASSGSKPTFRINGGSGSGLNLYRNGTNSGGLFTDSTKTEMQIKNTGYYRAIIGNDEAYRIGNYSGRQGLMDFGAKGGLYGGGSPANTTTDKGRITVEDDEYARVDLIRAWTTTEPTTNLIDLRGLERTSISPEVIEERWRLGKIDSTSDDFGISVGGTEWVNITPTGVVTINNIIAQDLEVDFIDFDTTATVSRATAKLWWNDDDNAKTLMIGGEGDHVDIKVGESNYFRVRASSAITKGQVVMITGSVGSSGGLTAAPATGLTKTEASKIMGIAAEDIALNSWGYITEFGLLRQIDTSAFSDGDILYYDPSVTGGLTATEPSAPNPKVEIAAVVLADASVGSVFIRLNHHFELNELNDINTTGVSNGDLLKYNSTSDIWEDTPQSSIAAGTADTLATARTISLTGDVSGSTSFDGSANVSITATVADDSHNHIIANIDGLQAALDAKLETESDPVFVASPAYGITSGDISNWNTAYGWGDHSTAGYLTSYTETDPTVPSHVKAITATQISNWDTAYGWGDHSTAGYQPSATALTTSTNFGGDVSGTYNAIVVADDSHNHIISNVDGLQTALDGKEATITILPVSKGGTGASSLTSGYLLKGNGTSAVSASAVYDDGTNIGLGTTSPVFSTGGGIEVVHASSANLRLNSDVGGAAEIRHGTGLVIETRTAEPVIVGTNSTEAIRIDSSQRVGINTTAPAGFLEINGGTGVATSGGTLIVRQDGDTNADGIALTSSNATSHRIWKNASGVLNIGSSSNPDALQQDLTGNLTIQGDLNTSDNDIFLNDGWLYFQDTGQDQIRLNGNGEQIDFYNQTDSKYANIRVGRATGDIDFRAPIFYDSANTSYYVDPASNSILNTARVENLGVGVNAGSYGLYVYHTDNFEGGLFQTNQGGSLIRFIDSSTNAIEMGIQSGNPVIRTGNTARLTVDNTSGYVTASQSFRAPIFYDTNDTAYFVNPASNDTKLNGMISNGRIDMSSTDGYQLESGKHRITHNDGGGNFNIRVGHKYNNESTETGYAGWIEYTQGTGEWQFWTTDASYTAGTTGITFNQAIRITPLNTYLYYNNSIRLTTTNAGLTVTGAGTFTGDLNFSGNLSGNSKQIFLTTDNYLRMNQSQTFTGGVWLGGSNLKQGSGRYIVAGSNGGTTNSRIYIYGGTYDGSNVISIDGSNGRITALESRAGIFYDRDDTTYYINPSSGSTSANFASTVQFAATTQSKLNLYSTTYQIGVQTSTHYFRSNNRFSWFRNGVHSNSENDPGTGGTVAMTLDNSSNLTVTGNVTLDGLLLQDSTNRSGLLSVDRKGTSAWTGYSIAHSGTSHWSLMGQEGVFGAYDDANNEWIWQYIENGRLELRYNGGTQGQTANGYFLANNQMRAPIFYDSNNTSYYLDPANSGTAVTVNGQINIRSRLSFSHDDTNANITNNTGHTLLYGASGSSMIYHIGTTEHMRLNDTGKLLLGTSSAFDTVSYLKIQSLGGLATKINTSALTSQCSFFNSNGRVGYIATQNLSTTYSTLSDERVKHDIVDAPEASSLIDDIQVRSFKWNTDNSEQRYGMIAQELIQVAPEAVVGDPDGEEMMAVDYSTLVPMLIKEVQSLRKRVAQLEGS